MITYSQNNKLSWASKTPHDWPQGNDQPDLYCPAAYTHPPLSHIFLYKPRSIVSTLETDFGTLVHSLPSVRLIKSKFLSCYTTTSLSLCLWILQQQVATSSVWDPRILVFLHPWAPIIPLLVTSSKKFFVFNISLSCVLLSAPKGGWEDGGLGRL